MFVKAQGAIEVLQQLDEGDANDSWRNNGKSWY
jgi:hypothetical protein